MIQGEIWLINLDPTVGAEIKKIRPCAIVSDNAIGALPLKIIAPFTDFKERYRVVPWMVVCEPELILTHFLKSSSHLGMR